MTSLPCWKRILVVVTTLSLTAGVIWYGRPEPRRATEPPAVPRRTRVRVLGAAAAASAPEAGAPAALPASVTLPGTYQTALGCETNWDPACPRTRMEPDPLVAGVYVASLSLPAGHHEYKVAIDGGWDVNFGLGAASHGENIVFDLPTARDVRFYYDHRTHWALADATGPLYVAAGTFQRQLGCPQDWDPTCRAGWMQDPAGTGTVTFRTRSLAAGDYEMKIALDESWAENFGADGGAGGANVPFHVSAAGDEVVMQFEVTSRRLSISAAGR
ncbi:MAG: hypothetical protein WCJ30_09180 [Deltaproteobacteria bacterium]